MGIVINLLCCWGCWAQRFAISQFVCWWVEIPRPTTWDGAKPLTKMVLNYQPQLVLTGFIPSTVLIFSSWDGKMWYNPYHPCMVKYGTCRQIYHFSMDATWDSLSSTPSFSTLRVASEALRLVMIDANSYRLQQAMKKACGQFVWILRFGGPKKSSDFSWRWHLGSPPRKGFLWPQNSMGFIGPDATNVWHIYLYILPVKCIGKYALHGASGLGFCFTLRKMSPLWGPV